VSPVSVLVGHVGLVRIAGDDVGGDDRGRRCVAVPG
jgi:hypothetical protein